MVYWYNSTSWRDDMAWAAAWMYRASGDTGYLADAYGYYQTHKDLEGDMDLRYLVRALFLLFQQRPGLTFSGFCGSSCRLTVP
jgi:hypothetical protein